MGIRPGCLRWVTAVIQRQGQVLGALEMKIMEVLLGKDVERGHAPFLIKCRFLGQRPLFLLPLREGLYREGNRLFNPVGGQARLGPILDPARIITRLIAVNHQEFGGVLT